MADNTQVAGGTGDTIRDVQKGGGTGPKTQVFILDRGGSGTEDVGALGDATNGIDVDVTRVGGNVAITGTTVSASTAAWTSATALNTALQISVAGLNTVTVSLNPTTTFTGGVIAFETSPDGGTTWFPVAMARVDSFTVETTYTIVASTPRAWTTSVDGFTNFRVRLSTVITGTGTANLWVIPQAFAIEPIVSVGQTAAGNMQSQVSGERRDTPTAVTPAAGQAAPLQVSNLGQQWVVQARPKRTQVASAGLTTATTAYTAGDQVGSLITFTNMALATGGGGYIESIMLTDTQSPPIMGAYTIWIFRSSVTLAADNAAFNLAADADMQALVGDPITLGTVRTTVANSTSGWYGSIPYDCAATSLFVALQTNAAHTFFGAPVDATALKLTITASILG